MSPISLLLWLKLEWGRNWLSHNLFVCNLKTTSTSFNFWLWLYIFSFFYRRFPITLSMCEVRTQSRSLFLLVCSPAWLFACVWASHINKIDWSPYLDTSLSSYWISNFFIAPKSFFINFKVFWSINIQGWYLVHTVLTYIYIISIFSKFSGISGSSFFERSKGIRRLEKLPSIFLLFFIIQTAIPNMFLICWILFLDCNTNNYPCLAWRNAVLQQENSVIKIIIRNK